MGRGATWRPAARAATCSLLGSAHRISKVTKEEGRVNG